MQHERLQTAARLTTMGEMASSLAHELNQPLGAIASYLAGSLNLIERGRRDRRRSWGRRSPRRASRRSAPGR